MTSMVLVDSTLESLTPSVNVMLAVEGGDSIILYYVLYNRN